ncbi:hypothetical protein ACMGDK_01850 [Chryseobacterium sp. DT-3]|uniref:hypothetical protein n=1 Tax=Chryseobacterium sp. DT-3 TaxID=3396164 RepID=UPI003F1BADF7
MLIKVDTLKSKENNSSHGTGTLILRRDGSFTSMETGGNYQKKDKILKIKYPDLDIVAMNISDLSTNYLLLSTGKTPKHGFTKKIKYTDLHNELKKLSELWP